MRRTAVRLMVLALTVALVVGVCDGPAMAAGARAPRVDPIKSVDGSKVTGKHAPIRGSQGSVPRGGIDLPGPTDAEPRALDGKWSKPASGLRIKGDAGVLVDVRRLRAGASAGLRDSDVVFELTPSLVGAEPKQDGDPAPVPQPSPSPETESTPDAPAPSEPTTPTPEPESEPTPDSASPSAATRNRGVEVAFDYADVARAFGGDWGGRLHLVLLTDCSVDNKRTVSCAKATPLDSTNDAGGGQVRAQLPDEVAAKLSGSPGEAQTGSALFRLGGSNAFAQAAAKTTGPSVMLAATTSAEGVGGDYSASSLKPTSSWEAGDASGHFNWSYPFSLPAGPADLTPQLALGYSSGAVDGQTSGANTQTSWIGEGFDLQPGFVERSYEPCKQVAGTPSTTADLCWRGENLTISVNGSSQPLVRVGATSEWRKKADDGTRIIHRTGAANRARNGEFWEMTTPDGTIYRFGRHEVGGAVSNSVSVVPVYAMSTGDPCKGSTFATSVCDQAWRWGLDQVVDPHGNTITYRWAQESNYYGSNNNATVRKYDRGAYLNEITYGSRTGETPAAKVTFTVAERCIPSSGNTCSSLTASTSQYWPDVPYDLICNSSTSCAAGQITPAFFTRKRLTEVKTQVHDGTAYVDVSKWALKHSFQQTGDWTVQKGDPAVQVLWLDSVQQTGLAGTAVTLPATEFFGTMMQNRVETGEGIAPFRRARLTTIKSGTGAQTAITYSPMDCSSTNKPSASALDSNARRCFPVWFLPDWAEESRQLEFFHKYRVDRVDENDTTGGSPSMITNYTYANGDGWHYTTNTIERPKYRTWSEWRGYGQVTTEVGATAGSRSYLQKRFLRGMHGDKLVAGGTKSVTVTDGTYSPNITDLERYAGMERRALTRNGAGGAVVAYGYSEPWSPASASATMGDLQAWMVRPAETVATTTVSSGTRTTKSVTSFDAYGLPTQMRDDGDTSVATDDRCTVTTYVRDTAKWMLDYPETSTTIGKPCGQSPSTDEDVIEATKLTYDGGTLSKGDLTRSSSALSLSDGQIAYQTDATTAYDAYGRAISVADAAGRATTTAFAPLTGVPTVVTVTNPLNQQTVTMIDRRTGQPTAVRDVAGETTTYTRDALGRVTAVWAPDRSTAETPNAKFTYVISQTSAAYVKTEKLNAASAYVPTFEFYDGLLRKRSTQTQAANSSGGRTVTDVNYDDRGQVASTTAPYYNATAPDATFWTGALVQIPSTTTTAYDLAGRKTKETLVSLGTAKWSTTFDHAGDRVTVTPPTGGIKETTVIDARGQTTGKLVYDADGGTESTTYAYTPGGALKRVTDAAGTVWSKSYDIRGNLVTDVDPDNGTSTFGYDSLDRRVWSLDAKGQKLWTVYDELGRKTSLHDTSILGPMRASWTYDTTRVGSLAESVRYTPVGEFTTAYESYDPAGRVTKSRVMLPTSTGALYKADGYWQGYAYNVDGSLWRHAQPTHPSVYTNTSEVVNYTYTPTGQVKAMNGKSLMVRDSIYDAFGRLAQRTSGPTDRPDVRDTRTYEEATGRLATQTVVRQDTGLVPVLDWTYGYDQAGNVTSLADVAPGAVWRQCFGYDHNRRLTDAWTQSTSTCAKPTGSTPDLGSTAPYWDSFSYDVSGNRIQRVQRSGSGAGMASTTVASTYPNPTSTHPHQPNTVARSGASSGSESLAVDGLGQLKSRSGGTGGARSQTLTWDAEGHVASVTDTASGKKTLYVYDADGNRLAVKQADGSVTLMVGNTEFTASAAGAVTFSRTYSVGGEAVAIRDDSGIDTVAVDHHATPVVLVDGATANVTRRRYSPFGEQLGSPPGWPSDREFLNKIADPTGYSHVEAREYDPTLGRFLSVDPIADFTNPQQINGYAYANNSPLTYSDPTGLCWSGFGLICDAAKATVNFFDSVVDSLVGSIAAISTHGASTGYSSGSGTSSRSGGSASRRSGNGASASSNSKAANDAAHQNIIERQKAPEHWYTSAGNWYKKHGDEISLGLTVAGIGGCAVATIATGGGAAGLCAGLTVAAFGTRATNERLEDGSWKKAAPLIATDAGLTAVSFGMSGLVSEGIRDAPAFYRGAMAIRWAQVDSIGLFAYIEPSSQ